MSIRCWNTRGIGELRKCRAIRETIRLSNYSVLYLQETKQEQMNQRLQRSIRGSRLTCCAAKIASELVGGLLPRWDLNKFDGNLVDQSNYSLTTKLTLQEK